MLGGGVSSARLRGGTVSLAHVAETELAVLTPPGSSPVSRIEPRRRGTGASAESAQQRAEWNRGAGSRSGVRRPRGRPAPRCCAGQARGAGRRGKRPAGRGGRAVLPCGACRRGVSAGRAGERARGQAERPGDSPRWADTHRGAAVRPAQREPCSRRRGLACLRCLRTAEWNG